MTDLYSTNVEAAEHWHNMQVERPERPSASEYMDDIACRECPYSGEDCCSDLCVPVCQFDDPPWDARDRADDEPEHSCFDRASDPMFEVLRTVAGGAELEARATYGDRVVDGAITRVLAEEGF